MSPIRLRAKARKRIPGTPVTLNISRSGVTPSIKIGRVTWNPKRHTTSIDTPGIGSVMLTPKRQTRSHAATPAADLLPEASGILRPCPACGAEVGDACRKPDRTPAARMHKARRVPAPLPVPRRPLVFRVAFMVGKVLGLLALAFPKTFLLVLAIATLATWVRLS